MITITKFRSYEKGSLIGFFDMEWDGFFIKKCKLFNNGKGRWFSFPSEAFEVAGEKKYSPYCGHVEASMRTAFQEQVMIAIDKFIAEQANQPSAAEETPF